MTRVEALKMAYAKRKNTAGEEREFLNVVIKVLEQEPKTGHWIEQDNGNMLTYHRYKCSVCGGKRTGETGDWVQIHDCKWRYCPKCGAKMESEE